MIIFHEGLPGSGKSYEAMAVRVIPALKAGREVVAYVEGIDHAKIAELCGITEDRCKELLFTLTREQMQGDWLSLCRDNALHIFDEAQNFWGNRTKLTPAQTQLITEHRHRGMDIVLMGQDLRDVNATWRRRVELKMSFLKLNAFGKGSRYSVTTYRHLGGDDFKKAGTTITKYNPKYFGTYRSHVSDDTNAEVYEDKRAQVWNNPLLKYAVPACLILAIWGGWNSWKFFHPDDKTDGKSATAPQNPDSAAPAAQRPPAVATAQAQAAKPDERTPIEKRMVELGTRGRIRLAGLIASKDHISGIVEWVQSGNVVIERLSLDALRALGVAVLVTENVVQLGVGSYREMATPWPLEEAGRISSAQTAMIRPAMPLGAAEPMPADVSRLGQASAAPDAPGPLAWSGTPRQGDEDAGSLTRRISRVAR